MMGSAVEVRQATVWDLDLLTPLFDAYRLFYREASDPERARQFLLERFRHNQSIVFLALDGSAAVGFTQLYPSFSSTAMARIFVLNDLFVDPKWRGRGVGSALLETAAEYGRRLGAIRLSLRTEASNLRAQALYEELGWKRNSIFHAYDLDLSRPGQ